MSVLEDTGQSCPSRNEKQGMWIGWIEEIPGVNCQEATREELLDSLRITLREALEFNKQDAISAFVFIFSKQHLQ